VACGCVIRLTAVAVAGGRLLISLTVLGEEKLRLKVPFPTKKTKQKQSKINNNKKNKENKRKVAWLTRGPTYSH
jgi:hypothetical protein